VENSVMNWLARIQSLFRRRKDPRGGLVAFLDVPSGRVVHIPPSELRPGYDREAILRAATVPCETTVLWMTLAFCEKVIRAARFCAIQKLFVAPAG
jgi:hypothetical protein